MKEKIYLKNLEGEELQEHLRELEMTDFVYVLRDVMKKLQRGDVADVTGHEVRYILKKIGV